MVEQWSPKRAIPSSRGIQPSINLNNKKIFKMFKMFILSSEVKIIVV